MNAYVNMHEARVNALGLVWLGFHMPLSGALVAVVVGGEVVDNFAIVRS